jgi:hypothetical protein
VTAHRNATIANMNRNAEAVACTKPSCLAAIGEPCKTHTGNKTQMAHATRVVAAREARKGKNA